MSSIKKRSLVDQVYERLRSDIISLELPLGSRVNVNELQESLGVSCTPIREAINRLQQEGLIAYENNVGARVLTLDATDVEEITQLATTLHCAAARLAMARTDHQVLAQELDECITAFETAQTPRQQSEGVHRFMEVFYVHCGNRPGGWRKTGPRRCARPWTPAPSGCGRRFASICADRARTGL